MKFKKGETCMWGNYAVVIQTVKKEIVPFPPRIVYRYDVRLAGVVQGWDRQGFLGVNERDLKKMTKKENVLLLLKM